jgi:hypothetical protein
MSTVPETPLTHQERARLVLDHIRSIKELIGGFSFVATTDGRTLNFAKSIRDEFFENTAVAIEASEDLAKTQRVSPDELRDVIAFSIAFEPVAAEFGIMQQSTLHTIALKRADVGHRALQVYHFGNRLTRKSAGGHPLLIPHLEAMKRSLNKSRKAPAEPAKPATEPAKPGGANA